MQRQFAAIIASAIIASTLPAMAATKINLLYIPGGDFVPSFVAKDQGIFEKHGLDVDLSIAQNGSVISAALASGSAQIGVPTPPVVLQAHEQGLDLVVIAGATVLPFPPHAAGMLARNDSGIKGPKDLVGKKVGVPGFGGSFDVMMRNWVKASGADYHKVEWIELQFPQMGDALKAGLADAVGMVNPFYGRVLDSKVGYDIGDPTSIVPKGAMIVVYAATRDWATKNAAAIKEFRASLDEGVVYVKNPANLDSVRASMAKYTKLPPAAAATVPIPEEFDVHAKPDGFKFWIEAARDQGLIKGNPDPATLMAP
jgi:NitT/TauT family transport system substrate-binding protein